MSKYLIRTVETYRVDSDAEAQAAIKEAKADKSFELAKYSSEQRCLKSKGEVIESWYRVILTKDFNIEKEPDKTVEVEYNVEAGYFPSYVDDDEDDEYDGN